MNGLEILSELAEQFRKKIDVEYSLKVLFQINNSNNTFFLEIVNGHIKTDEKKCSDFDVEIITTDETLKAIYDGKMTALTAAGKANISDKAPLDWKLGPNFSPQNFPLLYYFVIHFFNRSQPEKVLLAEEHSRVIHGAHAIPLYYHPGFRSAWYLLKKGQRMNDPGDTNTFPQAVIHLEGQGYAKIGEETIPVKPNESYYIPPNSDHVFWTEEDNPLVLIWLAWGKGA